jgi:hypothetical protein
LDALSAFQLARPMQLNMSWYVNNIHSSGVQFTSPCPHILCKGAQNQATRPQPLTPLVARLLCLQALGTNSPRQSLHSDVC